MGKIIAILFCTSLLVQISTQWLFKKEAPKKFLDKLKVKIPGLLPLSQNLPTTEEQAKSSGWRKTDSGGCDSSDMYRGNRYRKGNEYGTMLLFDSVGNIAGMQAAVPTKVEMTEKRKYMMPIADGRYHLTVYFKEPSKICSAKKTESSTKKFLIQNGKTWKSTMNIPLNEEGLKSTPWVKGKHVPSMGLFYWFDISKEMDCERVYPIYLVYYDNKLNSFGWTFKGTFNDPKFDHPLPFMASFAFAGETMPECIRNAKKGGSTAHIYLRE